MPLLGKTWEPPCDPYYYTFGLIVTASVYLQLSSSRSIIPDNEDPSHDCPADARAREPATGFDEFMREPTWKTKPKK
jgi:hypothetical protein